MSFELIRRKEGEISQKQEIRHKNIQISINDWGHLVIREFDDPQISRECNSGKCIDPEKSCYKCDHWKTTRIDDEHLIVFDKATTEKIINFIFSIRSTYELKQLLKSIIEKKIDDLPF